MLARTLKLVLDTILPPRCLGCNEQVGEQGALCSECWSELKFLGSPCCATCGQPFAYTIGEGAKCAACMAKTPHYDAARAVFRYDDASRKLITGFKYADRTHGAASYANWLARAGSELIAKSDVIAPVPLHWRRLFSRRYNQAALLSAALAKQAGLPHIPDLMHRVKHTPPQASLSRNARKKNVRGAFAIAEKNKAEVKDRRVLLIDDVTTTGATIEACARALKKVGASEVFVLTLAKTVVE